MCDCYWQKCEECETLIPVHISDSDYPRKEVKVFCSKHIPKERVTVFENLNDSKVKESECGKKGWHCGIRLCGGELEPDAEGVCPNVGCLYAIEVRK